MLSLNANEAKTKFGTMLINVQNEPVEIIKNGTPVAVVLSLREYQLMEELKMELVKSRFSDVDDSDLVDGDTFFNDLDSGKYD
ncbi:type II toxin-antitoxin system Phd/YefM family antitoxin [Shewanella frigidimarina]|jgi:prevent-host-death family protein|uniref:type II toxin-antitoxin system Phd/YefM family antitoxin n=1 Tax=Shewanella frigidimarina TaxID=56812 RepID=UPI003D7B754D|tara:strand:- start:1432 stop:1680 length:249 start_codon:yes stop_codon:yes gene_type:complete